jgi:hypothetical protein
MSSGKEGGKHPNPLRLVWKVDPKRPIYSALLEAEFQRSDKLFDGTVAKQLTEVQNKLEAEIVFQELTTLLKEATEIHTWIFPQRQQSFDFILTTAKTMRDVNIPEDIVKSFVKRGGHRPRGRPITKRKIVIQALERQILEPERKWSYRQLAQLFCNCGKGKHDASCGQSLRQSMMQLKRLLAKYAPHLPVNKSE